jgi:hypothetical protein
MEVGICMPKKVGVLLYLQKNQKLDIKSKKVDQILYFG